jgi:putative transposase
LRCRALRTQPGPAGYPGRQLRTLAAHRRRGSEPQGSEATAPDLRDRDHRALPPAGELGRGSADRDVSGGDFGPPGSEGFREILGICEGAKEDKSGWSAFLRHLVDRGLKGVQLVISDACRGLLESVADFLPEARYQRCMVHFYRNVFSHVPSTRVREVSHMLKAIHAQESREAADTKAKAIVDDLRASKMSKAADLVEQAVHETLTYYGFPDIHWQKIRTNNPLERIMKEIRRRTRVVGAFPDGQSCLNLAAARLRHIAGTTWSAKCYMNMRPLYQQQISETEAVA